MPITRLESAGQIDTLLDELKNSSGICVVSTKVLETILLDNAKLHEATQALNERLVSSTEQMNTLLQENAAEQSAARKDLNDRLDHLIEKISSNGSSLSPTHDDTNVDALLRKRRETIEKLTRNQEMSKYYGELLNEPEPFVRREFRTRVNKTTTARELVHRRQQSIERVQTEIKVMEDRVAEWTEKKNTLDQQIEEYLTTHEDKRSTIEQQMSHQVRATKDNFERNTMTKLKKTDDAEKMNSYEYLITVADNNSDSLNYRGQSSRSRMRRAQSQRAHQHEY